MSDKRCDGCIYWQQRVRGMSFLPDMPDTWGQCSLTLFNHKQTPNVRMRLVGDTFAFMATAPNHDCGHFEERGT